MNKIRISMLAAAAAVSLGLSFGAAAQNNTDADSAALTKGEAKSLKAQSDGQYKAKKNISEAAEDLNRADCKSSLDGSARRACEKSAKHAAKSDKAAAKATHEIEQKKIDDATQK